MAHPRSSSVDSLFVDRSALIIVAPISLWAPSPSLLSQMENNKFAMAAKIWKEMGMLHEKEHNAVGAMSCFQKAADWCAHGGHTNDGVLSLLEG